MLQCNVPKLRFWALLHIDSLAGNDHTQADLCKDGVVPAARDVQATPVGSNIA